MKEYTEAYEEVLKAYIKPDRSKYGYVGFKEELELLGREAFEKVDGFLRRGHRGKVPDEVKRHINQIIARGKERISAVGSSYSFSSKTQSPKNVENEWKKWQIVEETVKFVEDAMRPAVADAYKVMRRVIPSKKAVEEAIRLNESRSRIRDEIVKFGEMLTKPFRKKTKKEFGPQQTGKGKLHGGVNIQKIDVLDMLTKLGCGNEKTCRSIAFRIERASRDLAHYLENKDPAKALGYRLIADTMWEFMNKRPIDESHQKSYDYYAKKSVMGVGMADGWGNTPNIFDIYKPLVEAMDKAFADPKVPDPMPPKDFPKEFRDTGAPNYAGISQWLGNYGSTYTDYMDPRRMMYKYRTSV